MTCDRRLESFCNGIRYEAAAARPRDGGLLPVNEAKEVDPMGLFRWLFGKPTPPGRKRYEYPTGNAELAIRVERGEFVMAVIADIQPRWTPGNEHLWDEYDPESLIDTPEK